MPQVSIHMCTYNRAHFIPQAIDSVLSQTFQDWELLILDDQSTDNSEEVISQYKDSRIRYIKNPENLGITKNRNKALSLSTGKYVAVLDSDDYWTDNTKLAKQVDFLNSHPDYTLVGTNMTIINENGLVIKKVNYPTHNFVLKNLLLLKNFFCHSTVLYRKQVVLDLGSYDESLPIWEDYDLWLKIGLKHKFANLDINGANYRQHASQSNTEKKIIGQQAQATIINRYKNSYNGYIFAKLIDTLRNKRT